MFFRHILNIIFWTTPTKKTGISLFGGINSEGSIISLISIYTHAHTNAIGIIGSIIAISKKGIAGGGFINVFCYSHKGEAGAVIFSAIAIAPKGSTYGTFTLFAKDYNNSTEHHLCLIHPHSRHKTL